MQNGFIIIIITYIVNFLQSVSLVELWKRAIIRAYALNFDNESTSRQAYSIINNAIDVFTLAKWLYVTALVYFSFDGIVHLYLVCYLIFFNGFSYFYYHGWRSNFKQKTDIESQRRRFASLLVGIAFYIFSFSYIFEFHLAAQIKWPYPCDIRFFDALYLSVANAFTLTYPGFEPLTRLARFFYMAELASTFLFLTVLVGSSVPERAHDG